jgi:hypothetical protein
VTPGWEWGTKREETYTWKEQLENWKTVYTKIQKAPSTISKDKEEKRAGTWQNNMRVKKNKGAMSAERITALEMIHGWEWDSNIWEEQLENWKTVYTKIQKTPSTHSKDKEEKRAGKWQSTQRVTKNNGKMSFERIAALEAISGWEWGTEREESYTWEENLENWKTVYTKIQKTPSTHSKDKEEKRAGKWQSHQRNSNNKEKMSAERITALEATPGWEWGMKREETYTWEEQLENWKTVYTKIQNAPSRISKDKEKKRAGQWQNQQRIAKKNGTLSSERVIALEMINGWTWSAI